MIYPQLVQYAYSKADGFEIEGDWATSWETSADGKTWTFHLHPERSGRTDKPLTADDAAWTINTIVKYADGPTAVAAPALSHVKNAVAGSDNPRDPLRRRRSETSLAQLETLSILPQHVYEPLATANGKGLETFHPEQHMPIVTGGAYTLKQYEKKGTTVFIRRPELLGAEVERRRGRAHVLHERGRDDRRPEAGPARLGRPGAVQRDQRSEGGHEHLGEHVSRAPRRRTSRGTRTRKSRRTASYSTRR